MGPTHTTFLELVKEGGPSSTILEALRGHFPDGLDVGAEAQDWHGEEGAGRDAELGGAGAEEQRQA